MNVLKYLAAVTESSHYTMDARLVENVKLCRITYSSHGRMLQSLVFGFGKEKAADFRRRHKCWVQNRFNAFLDCVLTAEQFDARVEPQRPMELPQPWHTLR